MKFEIDSLAKLSTAGNRTQKKLIQKQLNRERWKKPELDWIEIRFGNVSFAASLQSINDRLIALALLFSVSDKFFFFFLCVGTGWCFVFSQSNEKQILLNGPAVFVAYLRIWVTSQFKKTVVLDYKLVGFLILRRFSFIKIHITMVTTH